MQRIIDAIEEFKKSGKDMELISLGDDEDFELVHFDFVKLAVIIPLGGSKRKTQKEELQKCIYSLKSQTLTDMSVSLFNAENTDYSKFNSVNLAREYDVIYLNFPLASNFSVREKFECSAGYARCKYFLFLDYRTHMPSENSLENAMKIMENEDLSYLQVKSEYTASEKKLKHHCPKSYLCANKNHQCFVIFKYKDFYDGESFFDFHGFQHVELQLMKSMKKKDKKGKIIDFKSLSAVV